MRDRIGPRRDAGTNSVDVPSSSVALGALDTRGGWTRNYDPGDGNVAIDSADPAWCLPADQRNYLRPAGSNCAAGSVEWCRIWQLFK